MQFGFLFLQMLICGYSVEQVTSFLWEMSSGRNLYFIVGIPKNLPEKEYRD
jgi:hypothetical protein